MDGALAIESPGMKKVFRIGVAVAGLVFIAFGLYAANLVRSLDTPEFKARVAREASSRVGAKVQLGSLDVSLLRGIRLGGVRIQNPPGFTGDLLTVDSAKLSYDLWPLLLGRVQVDELSLRKPVIILATDARGNFNYRRLAGLTSSSQGGSSPVSSSSGLLKLAVSKLSVDNARFALVDERKSEALRLEDASLDSTLAMESGMLTGTGKAGVDSVVLANALFLRRVRAPVKLTKERMSLSPLRARLGGGAVTGSVNLTFKPEMHYALQIAVNGASVATLLKEAGSAATLTGDLDAKARIEGTAGVATLTGGGNAEIKDCRWPKSPIFGAVADLLKIPELKDPRFDDCRVEFTLSGGEGRTPLVSFKSAAIELVGHGVTDLLTSAIDYDLTLAIAPRLLAKVPATPRAAFKTRPDGFGTIAFKVTGTTAAPKTDLPARLGKAVAIEAAKEGLLGRLFGKKKP